MIDVSFVNHLLFGLIGIWWKGHINGTSPFISILRFSFRLIGKAFNFLLFFPSEALISVSLVFFGQNVHRILLAVCFLLSNVDVLVALDDLLYWLCVRCVAILHNRRILAPVHSIHVRILPTIHGRILTTVHHVLSTVYRHVSNNQPLIYAAWTHATGRTHHHRVTTAHHAPRRTVPNAPHHSYLRVACSSHSVAQPHLHGCESQIHHSDSKHSQLMIDYMWQVMSRSSQEQVFGGFQYGGRMLPNEFFGKIDLLVDGVAAEQKISSAYLLAKVPYLGLSYPQILDQYCPLLRYSADLLLDRLHTFVEFAVFLLGFSRLADQFVGGEADGDGVEDDFVEELDTLINCGCFCDGWRGNLVEVGLEISSIYPALYGVEPGPEDKETSPDPVVLDLVAGVVAFGEVDEWAGEDPEEERHQFVNGEHLHQLTA